MRKGHDTWNVWRVIVDNVEQHDKKIHLVDDGKEHYAVIEVGLPPKAANAK